MDRPARNALVIGIGFAIAFAALSTRYLHFVLDDAYIIYRYAENWAVHGQLTWNLNDAPAEGYVNFLWVVLNALAIASGVDPVVFSRIFSVAAGVGAILVLAAAGRRVAWPWTAVAVAALALSPMFAVLAVQGLSTTLTALLLLVGARLSIGVIEGGRRRDIYAWHGVAVLSALCRLDTAPFVLGLFLGVVSGCEIRRDRQRLRTFLVTTLASGTVLIGYVGWRWIHYGSLFPTIYHVKMGGVGVGNDYVLGFVGSVMLPYLCLGLYLAVRGRSPKAAMAAMPVLLGTVFHLLYMLNVEPVQGHFWRFLFPTFPALLLVVLVFARSPAESRWLRSRALKVAVLVSFAVWTLRFDEDVLKRTKRRTQADRVAAGVALAGIEGRMFVTESGAVPFYSGWHSADMMGLTLVRIARDGLHPHVLADYAPDLIMLRRTSPFGVVMNRKERICADHMATHRFIAVAAVQKSEGQFHLYFVRRDWPGYHETARRLTTLEGVRYLPLAQSMRDRRIKIRNRSLADPAVTSKR